MPRFRPDLRNQTQLVAVSYHHQLHPGTFEHALNQIIDRLDVSGLLERYRNDETGAPAYHPAVLLKIVLFAYSRGIVSSRQIEAACRENVVFMALSGDTHPHFTTIARFVSSLGEQVVELFRNVLVVCAQEGLIGRQMFAVDGCRISSNCAKEWSGTRKEFEKKKAKLEEGVKLLVRKHREADVSEGSGVTPAIREKEQKAAERLRQRIERIEAWLAENPEDKKGSRGAPVQSNLVDNESAKMPSGHGVVQGYNGVAVVDAEHQVIVAAEAFGEAAEQRVLEPMIEGTRANFRALGEEDAFAGGARGTG